MIDDAHRRLQETVNRRLQKYQCSPSLDVR